MSKHEPNKQNISKELYLDETQQFIHDLNHALHQERRTRKKKDKKCGGEDQDKTSSWRLQKPSVIHMQRLESFNRLSLDGKGRVISGVTAQSIQGQAGNGKHGGIDNTVCTSVVASTSRVKGNANFPRPSKQPSLVEQTTDIITYEGDPRLMDFSRIWKTFDLTKLPKDPVLNLKNFALTLQRATSTSNPYLYSFHGNPVDDILKSGGSRVMLKTIGIQAGMLALSDFVGDGFFDSRVGFVRLAQSLTFSVYFQQNVRDLLHYVMTSQRARAIKENVAEFVNESVPHLGVGVSLVALNDMQEGWLPEDTVFSLGCVALLGCIAIKDKGLP